MIIVHISIYRTICKIKIRHDALIRLLPAAEIGHVHPSAALLDRLLTEQSGLGHAPRNIDADLWLAAVPHHVPEVQHMDEVDAPPTSHYTRHIFGRNSSDSSNKSLNSVSEERSLTYLRSSVRADS